MRILVQFVVCYFFCFLLIILVDAFMCLAGLGKLKLHFGTLQLTPMMRRSISKIYKLHIIALQC